MPRAASPQPTAPLYGTQHHHHWHDDDDPSDVADDTIWLIGSAFAQPGDPVAPLPSVDFSGELRLGPSKRRAR